MVEQDRPHMTIWRMRFVCWINKATDTHSEYAIFLVFPRQQWLRERACVTMYVRCPFVHADRQTDRQKEAVSRNFAKVPKNCNNLPEMYFLKKYLFINSPTRCVSCMDGIV